MSKQKKTKKENKQIKRKGWFRALKKVMRVRYKRPTFVFLGEKFDNGAVVLSNHEGTDAPLSLEIYLNRPIRMWGTYAMNSGLKEMYKYQTKVYYHQKKGWNLGLARLFCLIASPLTNMFYKGLQLISTYQDVRFMNTIKQSIQSIKKGENIVIYPEDSSNGYLAELEGFFAGFVVLAEACRKQGIDVPIVVSYYKKDENIFVFDKPVLFSELAKDCADKAQIADKLRLRCNELGKMQFDKETIKQIKEQNKNDEIVL
ncbi:MAG: hypothetical protein ACI4TZ_00365 [Christensenellales bacterium]